jgi:excisionase family DNA binding protein
MKPATVKAKQAAEYLNISYWKILDMVKKGEIPHIRAGKLVLFRQATLDRWLTEQEAANIEESK